MNWKLIYQTLDEMATSYDKVIINSDYTSSVIPRMKNLFKVVQINHSPHLFKSGMMFYALVNNILETNNKGGICLGSGPFCEKSIQKVFKNPNKVKYLHHLNGEAYDPTSGVLKGYVNVNFLPEHMPDINKKDRSIVYIGRAGKEKGADVALRTFSELNKLGFLCEMIVARNSFVNLKVLEELIEGAKELGVSLTVDPSHDYIMNKMAETEILFFSSRYETNGIVAFEGVVNGCKVLYNLDEPEHFLIPSKTAMRATMNVKSVEAIESWNLDPMHGRKWALETYSNTRKLKEWGELFNL